MLFIQLGQTHMSFNPLSFVKSNSLSPVGRMVNSVVSSIVGGLPINTSTIARNTAESFFNIGASFDSVSALTANKTDALVSGARPEFFAIAGRVSSRISEANLVTGRQASGVSTSQYIRDVNPSTKIRLAREEAASISESVL